MGGREKSHEFWHLAKDLCGLQRGVLRVAAVVENFPIFRTLFCCSFAAAARVAPRRTPRFRPRARGRARGRTEGPPNMQANLNPGHARGRTKEPMGPSGAWDLGLWGLVLRPMGLECREPMSLESRVLRLAPPSRPTLASRLLYWGMGRAARSSFKKEKRRNLLFSFLKEDLAARPIPQ